MTLPANPTSKPHGTLTRWRASFSTMPQSTCENLTPRKDNRRNSMPSLPASSASSVCSRAWTQRWMGTYKPATYAFTSKTSLPSSRRADRSPSHRSKARALISQTCKLWSRKTKGPVLATWSLIATKEVVIGNEVALALMTKMTPFSGRLRK